MTRISPYAFTDPPTCAWCDDEMVIRYRRSDAKAFWGCMSYPRCKHARDLRVGDHGVDSPRLYAALTGAQVAVYRALELWGAMTEGELREALGDDCDDPDCDLAEAVFGSMVGLKENRYFLRQTPPGIVPLPPAAKDAMRAQATCSNREQLLLRCGRCQRKVPEELVCQAAECELTLTCSGCKSRFSSADSRDVLATLTRWRAEWVTF